ncbi:MAG TPA: serine/threonine-protein kinase, partial [Planctomycetota bacterium]|nr:serine/threonine-protein kinase [Planctomycetota bacterium]
TFQEKLTQTGSLLGTVNIMSPEQALGDKIDYRTDIYSLGTVLYQLCTGQYPFDMSDTYSTLCAITTDQPITPSTFKPDIPKSLDQIILRCLEKKPENRYKTAQHLANDLKQFFYKKDTTNTLYGLQLQYKAKRRKTIFILSSFIFIMCMAGSYFFLQQLNILQKTTEDLSMIIACENTLSQLQLQCSMHINHIQEKCHDPSVYTDLFKNMTETTQYKNIKNNERYLHNLEQRLQQTPWDATLYKESTFLLTEMAKMHFENHQEEKAKKYQKQAEEKLRKYFTIQPYNKKIFTKFAEPYMYIIGNSTLKEDLHISQKFINTSILSWGNIEWSDLFPYTDICTTYLQKEKSTWNK